MRWKGDCTRRSPCCRESDTTATILYALNRWQALMRYCHYGAIEIDNAVAERAMLR